MSEINILYPFDNNYAPYAGVSLTSLLENNKDAEEINIYVLGFDLSDDNIGRFSNTVSKYNRNITFIDPERVRRCILELDMPSYRGSAVAAARLFASLYMPADIDKLLYLDSDTIITGNLCSLFDTDLSGNPVGMVCDSVAGDYKTYIGFDRYEDYYNAGVILYNMSEWRKQDCTGRIIDHIKNVRSNYEALDQDLINLALKGNIKRLDLRYNFQPFHLVYSPETYLRVYAGYNYYSSREIEVAGKNTVILHAFRYLGMFPWHMDSIHPCTKDFDKYKRISEWHDMDAADDYLKTPSIIAEKALRKMLPQKVFLRLFKEVFEFSMKQIEKKLKKNRAYTNI